MDLVVGSEERSSWREDERADGRLEEEVRIDFIRVSRVGWRRESTRVGSDVEEEGDVMILII